METRQFTKKEAIALHKSGIWEDMNSHQIVEFQLFQDRLCVPFGVFHKAIEDVLGRPVFTHEFAYKDSIIKEFLGEKQAPSFEEIISLIPESKRVLIQIP